MLDDDEFKIINEGIVTSQAMGLTASYIMMEVVIEMARRSDYPLSFVDKMHEKIFARMDKQPLEQELRPVNAFQRESVDLFFTSAKRSLQK